MCTECYSPALLYGGGGYGSAQPCIAGSPPCLHPGGCEARRRGAESRRDADAGLSVSPPKVPARYGAEELEHWREGWEHPEQTGARGLRT
jgi:hypothetical protein